LLLFESTSSSSFLSGIKLQTSPTDDPATLTSILKVLDDFLKPRFKPDRNESGEKEDIDDLESEEENEEDIVDGRLEEGSTAIDIESEDEELGDGTDWEDTAAIPIDVVEAEIEEEVGDQTEEETSASRSSLLYSKSMDTISKVFSIVEWRARLTISTPIKPSFNPRKAFFHSLLKSLEAMFTIERSGFVAGIQLDTDAFSKKTVIGLAVTNATRELKTKSKRFGDAVDRVFINRFCPRDAGVSFQICGTFSDNTIPLGTIGMKLLCRKGNTFKWVNAMKQGNVGKTEMLGESNTSTNKSGKTRTVLDVYGLMIRSQATGGFRAISRGLLSTASGVVLDPDPQNGIESFKQVLPLGSKPMPKNTGVGVILGDGHISISRKGCVRAHIPVFKQHGWSFSSKFTGPLLSDSYNPPIPVLPPVAASSPPPVASSSSSSSSKTRKSTRVTSQTSSYAQADDDMSADDEEGYEVKSGKRKRGKKKEPPPPYNEPPSKLLRHPKEPHHTCGIRGCNLEHEEYLKYDSVPR
jgi:hypothetical protein